jgi:hypothetical protein
MMMRVRFTQYWNGYRKGDVIQPFGALRNLLLKAGVVEPVKPEPRTEIIEPQTALAGESPKRTRKKRTDGIS